DQDWGMPTSTYFQDNIEFPFFDSYLRGDGKIKMPEAEMFETGTNRWRSFDRWPPPVRKETGFYFLPNRHLAMETAPAGGSAESDTYVSDPANPVPYQDGTIRTRTREYMIDDQRFASARPDVLTYQTEPLTSDITVAGPVTADL